MTFVPKTALIRELPPDPFKHVKYTHGMVLGVDDFTQEFAYLNGRDQWQLRGVIGYGTFCGLRLTVENAGGGRPQVVVAPGAAINPRGQMIRVTDTQCARLDDWLLANRELVLRHVGSPPGEDVRLYVVLCYRACETDLVPIPGEPCRSEDDSMAPSRLRDYHLLELRFVPPEQRQYDGIRDFVDWLRQIEVDNVADSPALREQFEQAIKGAIPQLKSPPQSPPASPPDYILGSPPESLVIPADSVCEYFNLAFRLWVTEVRPLWLGKNETCAGDPPDEECVLLGEIRFPINANGQVAVSWDKVEVDESDRPYILPLQLLQEWLLCGRAVGEGTPGADGASVELRRQGTEIQWRQDDDDPTWTTLFDLSDLGGGGVGPAGASVELRVDSGFIQWRQDDDDPTWTNLVSLADITGPQGPRGPRGERGTSFIVAAGRFNIDGTTVFAFNGMTVKPLSDPRLFYVTYNKYDPRNIVIKGTVINDLKNPPHFFEVIEGDSVRRIVEDEIGAEAVETGFVIRITMANNEVSAIGFMLEVSQFPEA